MREPKLGASESWEDFQEEFEILMALFAGLEHVLIGQYNLKPGDWQQHFKGFEEFFILATEGAVSHIRMQESLLAIVQDNQSKLKGSIHRAIASQTSDAQLGG